MARVKLRSDEWFNRQDEVGVRHRSALATLGFDPQSVQGKPIIGICHAISEFNNCDMGLQELVEPIKRGVAQAGGIALQFSTMGLGAEFLKPSDLPIEIWCRWTLRKPFGGIRSMVWSSCLVAIRLRRRN